MRHIPPHKLAELVQKRWLGKKAEAAQEHLETCELCQKKAHRIKDVMGEMREVAQTPAPELGWDHISARVYWSISSERRAQSRRTAKQRWLWGIGGVGAAVVAALFFALVPHKQEKLLLDTVGQVQAAKGETELPPANAELTAKELAEEKGSGLLAQLTLSQGEAWVDGYAGVVNGRLNPLITITERTKLRTGNGRLLVQFGEANAFRLGPNSELVLKKFSDKEITLEVVGLVDVDITRREKGQRFSVLAGERRVEVRGTAFRVEHREHELQVKCTRGKVAVWEKGHEVEVPAGEYFRVLESAADSLRAFRIPAKELQKLQRAMEMPFIDNWDAAGELSSVEVEIPKDAGAVVLDELRIEAVPATSLVVLAKAGKHSLSYVDREGHIGKTRWIHSAKGEAVRAEAPKKGVMSSRKRKAAAKRRSELQARLRESGRIERCLAPLTKRGLAEGAYIVFDAGIYSNGGQEYLNIQASNLSPQIQHCLRQVVESQTLSEGTAARFRLRLEY